MKYSDKKVIVFVVTSMGRGGAERVVSILANYYASIGWKVHIIMLWHDILEYKLDNDIQVHRLSNKGGNPYTKIPFLVWRLRKSIKKIAPMAVVSFVAQNNIISYIATRGLKVRLIPSERIDPASMKRGKLYSSILNIVYANATVSVLQTERARNFFPEKVRKNSVIIYNPVTVKCHAESERKKIIITAGRLEKQKNHKMLISAFENFHKYFNNYKLVIYGEGILRTELENLVKEKGLENDVFLPGAVSDIQEKEANAEIFVLSSDFEGMSNALMEAMAIGLPCITTDCAGSDELIENKKNGLLVKVGDEQGMLDAMLYMAENREEAEAMGHAAHTFSSVFATENVITKWRKTIEGEEYEP